MAKAKTIAKAKNAKPVNHPDAELIEACLNFAIELRGMSGAFEVDPTANCDFAERIDTSALKRAEKHCAFLSDCRPSTFDGLRAKAAALRVGLDQDRDAAPRIMRSLAADVVRFQQAIAASKSIATDAVIAP